MGDAMDSSNRFLRNAYILADAARKINTSPLESLGWATPRELIYGDRMNGEDRDNHVPTNGGNPGENPNAGEEVPKLLELFATLLTLEPESTNGSAKNGEEDLIVAMEPELTNGST